MTLMGLGGEHGDMGGGDGHFEFGHGDAAGADGHDVHTSAHGSNWLFGVITFRTMVAAVAFFGLGGLAGQYAAWEPGKTMLLAIAGGVGAMFLVHWVMRSLFYLSEDGTVRIQEAVGQIGSVYLRIPGERSGVGKVTVNVQGRSMEFEAVTAHAALPTGSRVVVTHVLDGETVEVAPATETVPA
jgi:hypothetical protein